MLTSGGKLTHDSILFLKQDLPAFTLLSRFLPVVFSIFIVLVYDLAPGRRLMPRNVLTEKNEMKDKKTGRD